MIHLTIEMPKREMYLLGLQLFLRTFVIFFSYFTFALVSHSLYFCSASKATLSTSRDFCLSNSFHAVSFARLCLLRDEFAYGLTADLGFEGTSSETNLSFSESSAHWSSLDNPSSLYDHSISSAVSTSSSGVILPHNLTTGSFTFGIGVLVRFSSDNKQR